MLCLCIIDTSFLSIITLHHVQWFLINWFSKFYDQTVFVYERAMCLIALENKHFHYHYLRLKVDGRKGSWKENGRGRLSKKIWWLDWAGMEIVGLSRDGDGVSWLVPDEVNQIFTRLIRIQEPSLAKNTTGLKRLLPLSQTLDDFAKYNNLTR